MTVAFDFGAIYKGYCSDFGRSVFIGEPHPEALAAYEAITSGNLATMPVMRDGQITPTGVANFMRDHVAARGFGKHYMYEGLGHAIGLEVHEEPCCGLLRKPSRARGGHPRAEDLEPWQLRAVRGHGGRGHGGRTVPRARAIWPAVGSVMETRSGR